LSIVARGFGRVHAEIVRAATAVPCDLLYGGTTGALTAIAEAARRQSIPYGIDLEDWHSGESSGPGAMFDNALAARVEAAVVPGAAFVTTSSEPIASVYNDLYGVRPAVVHNTFPLPSQPPDFARRDPSTLRLYWFSQTIGPGRGLEETVIAAGRAGIAAELALRGRRKGRVRRSTAAAAHAPWRRASRCARRDGRSGSNHDGSRQGVLGRSQSPAVSTNKAFTYIWPDCRRDERYARPARAWRRPGSRCGPRAAR
jgi:hypothetical protein